MGQTSNYTNAINAYVGIQTGASTNSFTNISGFSNNVTVSGGDRDSGEEYTHDGGAIIMTGARKPAEITVRTVFTNPIADPFSALWHCYTGGSLVNLHWAPSGSAPGNLLFTTVGGKLLKMPMVAAPATDAKPAMFEFSISANTVEKSTIV